MDEADRRPGELSFESLRTRERRAAMGRLASSLSHALGTPLNVIAGRAAMIGMGDLSPQEMRDNARIIEQQVRGITELLQRALRFLRDGWEGPSLQSLDLLTRRAVELCQPIAEKRGVRLELSGSAAIEAQVDAGAFQVVLVNLLTFAIARAGENETLRLSLERRQAEPPPSERGRVRGGSCACISVRAPGELDSALIERVHEPWLAEPREDRDQQLQLAICFGVMREIRGWVDADATPAGTTLTACFPLSV